MRGGWPKGWLIGACLLAIPLQSWAAGGHVTLQEAHIDLSDRAALQRGAKLFSSYCMGCHSAQYQRYSRLAADLGLSAQQIEKNFIFTDKRLGETMTNAMRTADAEEWFGKPPPDLTLVARARGADWLYTYLQSFYLDDSRPLGVNNLLYPKVAMPHVLWQLQGWQKPVYKSGHDGEGEQDKVVDRLELVEEGELSAREYDHAVRDLVTFLVYLSEPVQLQRKHLGFYVLAFLILLAAVTYLLKKEYWRDVH